MAVYNGREYLGEAIDSILNQTFKTFEFIIINDGSDDDTLSILSAYNDKRIRIINNGKNIGLSKSLNIGILNAKGLFIARMDADDISHPSRFQQQVQILENNKNIGICGTWFKILNQDVFYKYPVSDIDIKLSLLFHNPICHSSVLIRKECIDNLNLFYDENVRYAQDYDLWIRASQKNVIFYNVPEFLLNHRIHNNRITSKHESAQKSFAMAAKKKIWEKLLVAFSNNEKQELFKFINNDLSLAKQNLKNITQYVNVVIKENYNLKIFPEKQFSDYIRYKLLFFNRQYYVYNYIINRHQYSFKDYKTNFLSKDSSFKYLNYKEIIKVLFITLSKLFR